MDNTNVSAKAGQDHFTLSSVGKASNPLRQSRNELLNLTCILFIYTALFED